MPRRLKNPAGRTDVPGITKVGPEQYLVRARWRDEKGRRKKREGVAATFAEAVALKEEMIGNEAPRERPIRGRYKSFAKRWYAAHVEEVSPSTQRWWEGAIAHTIVGLGGCYTDTLTASDIRK